MTVNDEMFCACRMNVTRIWAVYYLHSYDQNNSYLVVNKDVCYSAHLSYKWITIIRHRANINYLSNLDDLHRNRINSLMMLIRGFTLTSFACIALLFFCLSDQLYCKSSKTFTDCALYKMIWHHRHNTCERVTMWIDNLIEANVNDMFACLTEIIVKMFKFLWHHRISRAQIHLYHVLIRFIFNKNKNVPNHCAKYSILYTYITFRYP